MLRDLASPDPDGVPDADAERAQMGRESGGLWVVGAFVGALGVLLPGASHEGIGWVLALCALALIYGVGSVTGIIPWQRASLRALAIGMVVTVPVVGLAIYLTGGSLSYIEPLLVCSLLYAAFFFPPRWAWPLSIEVILVAGTPLLYDDRATDNAFLPRYMALAAGFVAVTWVMVRLKRRLVDAEARQRAFANSDPLTGVGNRRAFDAALQRELAARPVEPDARRSLDSLALLIIDLDGFKAINDAYGHPAGDAALRRAATRIREVLRATDTLARIGGDEFAVLAPGAGPEGARRLADAIADSMAVAEPGSSVPAIQATVGWALYPDDGSDSERLLHVADQRMLRSKRARGPALSVVSSDVAADARGGAASGGPDLQGR